MCGVLGTFHPDVIQKWELFFKQAKFTIEQTPVLAGIWRVRSRVSDSSRSFSPVLLEVVLASGDLMLLLDARILPIILVLAICSDEAFGDEVLGEEGVIVAFSSPVAIHPGSEYVQVLQESYLGRPELSSHDMFAALHQHLCTSPLKASLPIEKLEREGFFFCDLL